MLFEYLSITLGIVKILIYKIFYPNRLSFKKIPLMNKAFSISTKRDTQVKIGKNFRSRNYISIKVYDKGKLNIGDNCFLNDNCSINCQENINIGNNVMFGQNVLVFDHDHDYKNDIKEFVRKRIFIGDNVWVGANCIILKGVEIGNNVVIAANTTVKEDIPNNTLYYQNKTYSAKKMRTNNE